jgi:hypothetical protein
MAQSQSKTDDALIAFLLWVLLQRRASDTLH